MLHNKETFNTFAMERKIRTRLSAKFVRYIEDAFFIFDEGNIVVLFNGFQKKSQKTPKGEIEKVKQIKKAYYERTR